ncbi:hypothetical protein EDC01DRAFT_283988 [Geopyxis carbonaria]|nr:hypothetical protein EDC01DRAFT_283988 [Geopyxis carbonaria]
MDIDPRLQPPVPRPPQQQQQQQHIQQHQQHLEHQHHIQQQQQHYQQHQSSPAPNTPLSSISQPFTLPPLHTHPQSRHSTPQHSPHAGTPSSIDPVLNTSGSFPSHYASSAPSRIPSTTSVPSQAPHQQTASPSTGKPGHLPPDLKRPRACESCRALKVRCQPHDPTKPTGPCRRCTKAGRECIFTVPTRKRQKKTDTKVAELEKKIDALTASLNATRQARATNDEDDEDDDGEGHTPMSNDTRGEGSPGRPYKRRRSDEDGPESTASMIGSDGLARVDPNVPNMNNRQQFPDVQKHMRQFLQSARARVAVPSYVTGEDRFLPTIEYMDVVDQQLLSIEMAVKLFHHYNENMAPTFPIVIFPSNMHPEELRKSMPTLFVAVLAVASGTSHPDLHRALQKETTRAFAERIMVNGEKSMELVKALLILSVWYYPPDRYEELKFYNLIHQAAIMALDLGLGKNLSHLVDSRMQGSAGNLAAGDLRHTISEAFNSLSTKDKGSPDSLKSGGGGRPGKESSKPVIVNEPKGPPGGPKPGQPKNPFPDPTTIESRRTWLACYWSCSHVAISMRRPNLLRHTRFMNECLDELETNPEAARSDKVLCQWVRLQMISEELADTFAFDDPGAHVTIEDQSMQNAVKGFARRLEEWTTKINPSIMSKSLDLNYHLINLFAHEIALHVDHNVEDFRPPFTERIIRQPSVRAGVLLSSFHIEAISTCIKSAQAILDAFVTYTTFDLHCVPVFTFVRVAYASMILIKIYFTTKLPGSELGRVIDSESLCVEDYLGRTLSVLAQAAKGDRNRPAGKFTMILIMLRSWYFRRKSELEKTNTPEADSMEHDTPETPDTFNPPRNPQTPLQLLSNAAAGLAPPGKSNPYHPHHQHPQHQQPLPSQHYAQYPTPQDQTMYDSPGTSAVSGQSGWGPDGVSNMVEFQAGDLGLGLGGPGADMFLDDSFWGIMDQNGMGMTAWMGPLGEWGFG